MGEALPKPGARNLGELRAGGYRPRSVKQEMRENVLRRARRDVKLGEHGGGGEERGLLPGILGYDETVLPQVAAAILSRHDLLLLGLRGQAKTRMLRAMVALLDEWIPVIAAEGVELRDD